MGRASRRSSSPRVCTIFDGVVYDISQRFRCPFEVEYSKSICILHEEAKYNAAFDRCVDVMSQMLQKYGHQVLDKLEQDAPQEVEYSEESNQAQLLTDKAA